MTSTPTASRPAAPPSGGTPRAARTSRAVHGARRAVPGPLVPYVARVRARLAARRERPVARSRAEVAHLLDAVLSPAELDDVARRYLRYDAWRAESRWHPELITRQPIEGLEHLERFRDTGRPCLLSFLHTGLYDGALASIARAGVLLDVFVAELTLSEGAPAFLRQLHSLGTSTGNRAHDVGAPTQIVRLLKQGRIVALASDVPGTKAVRFLGKDVLGSFGTPHLAHRLGVPVVLMTAHPDARGRETIRLSAPVDPAGFASADDLFGHLLAHHERAVLDWPEAYHQPTLRWGLPGTD